MKLIKAMPLIMAFLPLHAAPPATPKIKIQLMWNENPDPVDGYRIFFTNATPEILTNYQQIGEATPQSNTTFTMPNAWCDLQIKADRDQAINFRLKAFRGELQSEFSGAVNTTLDHMKDKSMGEWCAPSPVIMGIR